MLPLKDLYRAPAADLGLPPELASLHFQASSSLRTSAKLPRRRAEYTPPPCVPPLGIGSSLGTSGISRISWCILQSLVFPTKHRPIHQDSGGSAPRILVCTITFCGKNQGLQHTPRFLEIPEIPRETPIPNGGTHGGGVYSARLL